MIQRYVFFCVFSWNQILFFGSIYIEQGAPREARASVAHT